MAVNVRRTGYWAIAALAAAVVLWAVGWLVAGTTTGPSFPGMMPWAGGGLVGWPAMLFMMLGMAFFWLALILGIATLVGWVVQGSGRAEDPLDIARRRYAKGEISREEYERLRDDLGRRA